jgi:hypothetical protein
MAFQATAFQGSAFQSAVSEPPEPEPELHVARGFEMAAQVVSDRRRAVTAVLNMTASAEARVEWWIDEEDVRRRVRDYLASLIG